MPLWLWIVWAFFGLCTFAFAVMLAAEEVEGWYRARRREREFVNAVIAWAEREEALRTIGPVPRDRSAA